MRRKKILRELAHGKEGHPICRELIERDGLVPHVLASDEGMFWDGCNAIDRIGNNVGGISDSMQKEMIRMIVEGRYGEVIKEAFLDGSIYWKIRDDLITWPNQKKSIKITCGLYTSSCCQTQLYKHRTKWNFVTRKHVFVLRFRAHFVPTGQFSFSNNPTRGKRHALIPCPRRRPTIGSFDRCEFPCGCQ